MSIQQIRAGVTQAMKQSPHRRAVRRIALFGSQRTGAATPKSDVDLLIELQQPIGFFALMDIQAELESALQQTVDLRTPSELSRYFRDDVLKNAEWVYEG